MVLGARRVGRLTSLAEEIDGRVVELDVTDRNSVRALADGPRSCSVLVDNAGGALGAETVATTDPSDWEWMFRVKVLGTLSVTQALLPALSADGGGTIVTITLSAGFVNYEGEGGYSAAEHAEHAMIETLRLELCGRPVRVIEIAPGMVQTEEFSYNRFREDAERAAAILCRRRPAAAGGGRRGLRLLRRRAAHACGRRPADRPAAGPGRPAPGPSWSAVRSRRDAPPPARRRLPPSGPASRVAPYNDRKSGPT